MSKQTDLEILEEDYFQQPRHLRERDYKTICALREELGLPPVDENLNPLETKTASQTESVPKISYEDVAALYSQYLKKKSLLDSVVDFHYSILPGLVTGGQTPVKPLAIGVGGKPILCDRCSNPIILEGGGYHKVYADEAWTRNPSQDKDSWTSWISGGLMTVHMENGTVRFYHGYTYSNNCYKWANEEDDKLRENFQPEPFLLKDKMRDYLLTQIPASEVDKTLRDIEKLLYAYDPGLGNNYPGVR